MSQTDDSPRTGDRFGTSGGVWGLERGYCQMIGGETSTVERLDPIFKALAPGRGDIPRTPGREKASGTAENGSLHCGPSGAGHSVKMVHNGIEYGLMAAYTEGLNILKHANAGHAKREIDAETTPLRDPDLSVRPQLGGYRRGMAARERGGLLASRPYGHFAVRAAYPRALFRARAGFGRRAMDDCGDD